MSCAVGAARADQAAALSRRAVLALHERLLEPVRLTYPQQLLLRMLDGGGMRRADLAARLMVTTGVRDETIASSVAAGLVEESGPGSAVVELTPRGRALLPRLTEIGDAVCAGSGLTPEDRAHLRRLIESVG